MAETLIRPEFKVTNARNFVDSVGLSGGHFESVYLVIGRRSPWSDETAPDVPDATVDYDVETRSHFISMKRINSSDVNIGIRRIDWETGTVYDEYTDQLDSNGDALHLRDFYVLTDANNVYKCISNNNNASSTIKPTGTSTSTITTGDGYQWKFMFDIPAGLATKFLTPNWIPVPQGASRTALQLAVEAAAAYSSGTPIGGHGKDAALELYAYYVIMSTSLEYDEGDTFPVGDDFRQIILWVGPRNLSDILLTGNRYSIDDSNTSVDIMSGYTLYIENRTPIIRNTDQIEKVVQIFEF